MAITDHLFLSEMFNLFKKPQPKKPQEVPNWVKDLCQYLLLEEVPYCSSWKILCFYMRAYVYSLPWTTTFYKTFSDYNEDNYYILAAIRENGIYLAGREWNPRKSVEENMVDVFNVYENNKNEIKNVFLELIEKTNKGFQIPIKTLTILKTDH